MLARSAGDPLFNLALGIALAVGAVMVLVGLATISGPVIAGGAVLLAPSLFILVTRWLDGPGAGL
jgi:hypothetical protein